MCLIFLKNEVKYFFLNLLGKPRVSYLVFRPPVTSGRLSPSPSVLPVSVRLPVPVVAAVVGLGAISLAAVGIAEKNKGK